MSWTEKKKPNFEMEYMKKYSYTPPQLDDIFTSFIEVQSEMLWKVPGQSIEVCGDSQGPAVRSACF